MDFKTLVIIAIIILVILGLLWLGFNLGLGPGGGGKGKGEGNATQQQSLTEPPPAPDKEQIVMVSGGTATLNGKPITPAEVAQRARGGQKFVIQSKVDAQAKIMEEFQAVERGSEGRVVIKYLYPQ